MPARRTMFANAAFCAASAFLVLAGGAAEARQPSMGPPPGRLIDVGGYKLHIHCVGEGAPTVIVDGGAGAWSIHYAHIQKALSGARVCTYDRAGLGWSDAGPSPRTSERMVEELHTLLHGAGVAPPLILAWHSLGGYNVRIYQARYPEEVGAIVLLDAAHEQQWDRLPPQAKALTQASVAGLRKRGEQARAGQLRAEEITPPGVLAAHSPGLRDAYIAAMLTGTRNGQIGMQVGFRETPRVPLPRKEPGQPRGRSTGPSRGTALLRSRGVPTSCGPHAPGRAESMEADPPLGQVRATTADGRT